MATAPDLVEEHVKDTRHIAPRALVRGTLTAFIAAAGFALAGCAEDPVPAAPPPSPAPPVEPTAPPPPPSPPPGEPTPMVLGWTGTLCQALDPIFSPPPQVDLTNPAAARQAYSTYLADAQTATEQALGRLQSLGAPPVENGQQVLDDLRAQVTDLRADLADARPRLDQAEQNDIAAVGNAIVAAGNVVGSLGNTAQVLGVLEVNPELDAAVEQAPACEDLAEANRPTATPTS